MQSLAAAIAVKRALADMFELQIAFSATPKSLTVLLLKNATCILSETHPASFLSTESLNQSS